MQSYLSQERKTKSRVSTIKEEIFHLIALRLINKVAGRGEISKSLGLVRFGSDSRECRESQK